ncbi:hypothetical protein J7E81_22335 [Bacillus sp. ISL-18]|uniref:hypothetical protein n=1 Tax=Bacillus sp. ISL-18 TaxID=2819118 RepID=UPI001BE4F7DF|nr:hypothetical protein [Bacillus sp. ISL-18]MBT2657943.1 hypothetical protein [Bacillus sp. ISL-18]
MKLSLSRFKSEILNLAGGLMANEAADKGFAIKRLLENLELVENSDEMTKNIKL